MFVIALSYEIRIWPTMQVNGICGQRCLGLFLLEVNRHKEKLLNDNIATQTHLCDIAKGLQQIGQVQFVVHIGPDSWSTTSPPILLTNKGHFSCHQRCFPRCKDISILDQPSKRSFKDKRYCISDLRILHAQMTRFFSQI